MTYQEKLRDPRWQRKRTEIFLRDDFTCQICGTKKVELHVHHKYYNGKDPWDIENEALTTLCKNCHSLEEMFKDELKIVDDMGVKISIFQSDDGITTIISDSGILNLTEENFNKINAYRQKKLK